MKALPREVSIIIDSIAINIFDIVITSLEHVLTGDALAKKVGVYPTLPIGSVVNVSTLKAVSDVFDAGRKQVSDHHRYYNIRDVREIQ
jgi:hypothetical protein